MTYSNKGGDPYKAWQYYRDNGIVSGGSYNSNEGCKPYIFPPRVTEMQSTPVCQKQCVNGDNYRSSK
jgi:cathepsin B